MRKVFRGDLNRFERLCKIYKKQNRSFIIKNSGSVSKIILDNREMIFKDKNENKEIPILCKKVICDVKKWIDKNPKILLDSKKVVFHHRKNIEKNINKFITGYDIISCYWEIAYRDKLISEKTYNSGVENKSVRTLAIGNLNKRTYKTTFKDSKEVKEIIESQYSSAYNYIIKEVQNMYYEISEMFKNEICAWRTDCVYLPKENEKEIVEYFKGKQLKIKSTEVKILEVERSKVQVKNIPENKITVWNIN